MIIRGNLPGGHTIFCDDVRQEVGGKRTYVGVYDGSMIIKGNPPIVLPKLALIVQLEVAIEAVPFEADLRIIQSGTSEHILYSEIHKIEDPQDVDNLPDECEDVPFDFYFLQPVVSLTNVYIAEPCILKVRAYFGNNELLLGRLEIYFEE